MTFIEFKTLINKNLKKIENSSNKELLINRLRYELIYAKNCYDNNIDLYIDLENHKEELNNSGVIPYLLGITEKIDLSLPLETEQIKRGDSGGLDIDSDISPEAKIFVEKYLREKYGEDRVINIGTYGKLGKLSAIKDVLKYAKVPFQESNNFTKELGEGTFEEDLENFKSKNKKLYSFYESHKEWLDNVKGIENKIRSVGMHAGGISILDQPVYKRIPVALSGENIVSAFSESGNSTECDLLGIQKYDFLGLKTLDIIKNTIEFCNETIYEIEDDDGIIKYVPESYIPSSLLNS